LVYKTYLQINTKKDQKVKTYHKYDHTKSTKCITTRKKPDDIQQKWQWCDSKITWYYLQINTEKRIKNSKHITNRTAQNQQNAFKQNMAIMWCENNRSWNNKQDDKTALASTVQKLPHKYYSGLTYKQKKKSYLVV